MVMSKPIRYKTSKDIGSIHEYGLCFDYVPRGTFSDQKTAFFRWQLSTGGPGDEFRFYVDVDKRPYRIDYVYLNWFDGATLKLYGTREALLTEIWQSLFCETGTVDQAVKDAQ